MPRLHLGCGNICYTNCVNIDIKPLKTVDVVADIRHLPFQDECADEIIAHHVFEHIPRQETENVLNHWHGLLKAGGVLDIELPDFDQNCRDYVKALDDEDEDVDAVAMNKAFIFGGDTSASEDGHRWGYSPKLMGLYLRQVGFKQINGLEPTKFHRDQAACFRISATK